MGTTQQVCLVAGLSNRYQGMQFIEQDPIWHMAYAWGATEVFESLAREGGLV